MFRRKNNNSAAAAAVSPLPAPDDPRMSMSSMGSTQVGVPPHRIASNLSVDTTATNDTVKNKRRSGFLGLGRKKDKDEPLQQTTSRPMSSFSVNGRGPIRQQSAPEGFVQENGRVVPRPGGQQQHVQMSQQQQQQMQMQQQQLQQQQQQHRGDFGPAVPANVARTRASMGAYSPRQDQYDNPVPPSPASSAGTFSKQQQPTPGSAPVNSDPQFRAQFEPIMELISLQPHKTYVASPPELEMITARTSAGQQPKQGVPGSPTNDWDAVWLQLSGTSLSMWSMKETRAAAARGAKVPPTYFNITESSLEILNPLPPPPHRPDSHPHNYVFSLNTAGSNRLLLSCPSDRDLLRWTTGLRLAAWERSRLEEIFTAHLIKSGGQEPVSPLTRGRYEGWVRVRIMGGIEWHRLWLVLSDPAAPSDDGPIGSTNKRHSLFGLKQHEDVQEPNTGFPMASFYQQPRTAKNRTTSLPVLTLTNVTQAYAAFPERAEVIVQSNLMKVVGRISGEWVTIETSLRESGWAFIMPEAAEVDPAPPSPATPVNTMLRWATAFHDVFKLYGRPERYSWDKEDPRSLVFAYPQGEFRGDLFLSLDDACAANYRSSTPRIRSQFVSLVQRRPRLGPAPVPNLRDEKAQYLATQPETIPEELPEKSLMQKEDASRPSVLASRAPVVRADQPSGPQAIDAEDSERGTQKQRQGSGDFRLPPLSFNESPAEGHRSLAPITEGEGGSTRAFGQAPQAADELPSHLAPPDLKHMADQTEQIEASPTQRSNSLMTDATFGPAVTPPIQQQYAHVQASEQMARTVSGHSSSSNNNNSHPANGNALGTDLGMPVAAHEAASTAPPAAVPQPGGGSSFRGEPSPRTSPVKTSPVKPSPVSPAKLSSSSSSPPTSRPQALAAAGAIGAGAAVAAGAAAAAAAAAGRRGSHRQDSQSSRSQHSDTLHAPKPQRAPSSASEPLLRDEPAAMYLMNMVEEPAPVAAPAPAPAPPPPAAAPVSSVPAPPSQATSHAVQSPASPSTSDRPARAPVVTQPLESHRPEVHRRPSGARALPSSSTRSNSNVTNTPRLVEREAEDVREVDEEPDTPSVFTPISDISGPTMPLNIGSKPNLNVKTSPNANGGVRMSAGNGNGELGDAATYLAYADQQTSPVATKDSARSASVSAAAGIGAAAAAAGVGAAALAAGADPNSTPEVRSSFAPSKAAAERRAKQEAQESQQRTAINVPGGGRRANRGMAAAVRDDDSSDEDEDEVSEEERSPEPEPVPMNHSPYPVQGVERRGSRALPAIPPSQQQYQQQQYQQQQYQHQPSYQQTRSYYDNDNGNGNGNGGDYYDTPTQSMNHLSINQAPDRPRSRSPPAPHRHLPTQPQQGQQQPQQHSLPQPPATRTNVWNANFAVEHGMQERKGTFVQLEEPSVTLTKAFTPGGLLSAGLQDKDDRSAKRQEEVARETGSSLINVPAKPPPPSTGLLGVVAQHESQRSNPGGIGATLTDRDRDRRIAEERQRKIDELQRDQQQQQQQMGMGQFPSQMGYGGFQQFPGGMPQMGYGGMPPMGYNPYGMAAAQQQAMMAAQMAYQQTIYAMSQAGSQMGDAATNDGRNSPTPSNNRASSPFGAYGMPPPPPMSMYGFPGQFGMMSMPGSPMGGMSPQMGGGQQMPGWASPGAYGQGMRPMSHGGGATGDASPAGQGGASFNDHEERNAS